MKTDSPIVYVLDDDPRVREALSSLLLSSGLRVEVFASATEYLIFKRPDCPSCLVLDLELPGMNGLELQREIAGPDAPPIVFVTGHGDVPSSVRAMKAGAVEFLLKPFDTHELLKAIDSAIAQDREARVTQAEIADLRRRYGLLTPREREVLPLVVAGLLNKQTAAELGTSEITIQVHRGQIMRKMAASSLAELVKMAGKLGISCTPAALYKDIIAAGQSSGYDWIVDEGSTFLMAGLAKQIVAVVDDDPRIRESLESLIASAGLTACVFSRAEDFLRGGHLAATGCLITDVRMPGLDGVALQRRVRSVRPDLPVIFISAHHDDEVERRALAEGAACFFRKPFNAGELLRATRMALSKSSTKHNEISTEG